MDFDLFLPQTQNNCSCLQRSYYGWTDPLEDLLLPLALVMPHKSVQRRGASEVANDSNKFEVKPEEMDVKTVDNNKTINGKHEERMGRHGWVSRQFMRWLLKECESNDVKTSLSPNRVLIIETLKKRLEPLIDTERVVPINVIHN